MGALGCPVPCPHAHLSTQHSPETDETEVVMFICTKEKQNLLVYRANKGHFQEVEPLQYTRGYTELAPPTQPGHQVLLTQYTESGTVGPK